MRKKADVTGESTCKGCFFFDRVGQSKYGFCLRYPPTVLGVDEDGSITCSHPVVNIDQKACGEFSHSPKVLN